MVETPRLRGGMTAATAHMLVPKDPGPPMECPTASKTGLLKLPAISDLSPSTSIRDLWMPPLIEAMKTMD
jgi:hypothetical protein